MFSRLFGLAMVGAVLASGQAVTHKVDLPGDSPVAFLNADFGNSSAMPRGGASQVDLHARLTLRNVSQKRIRSIALAVQASDVTAGGKGAVSLPSLNVGPGESFTVPVEMSLLRPLSTGSGRPTVAITLDGILFDDLTFFGPGNSQRAQRTMMLWELEARRDREYFKSLLASNGKDALAREMQLNIDRRSPRRPGVQLASGRATVLDSERELQFAFVNVPGAPVQLTGGAAHVADNLARDPRIEVLNRSAQPVDHVQIGWIVKDQGGLEFLAASLGSDVHIAPNKTVEVAEDSELRLERPVKIQAMTGYVSSVQFAGGSYWVPPRSALALPGLRDVVPPSPEEQRLRQIYSKQGIDALVEELKKF